MSKARIEVYLDCNSPYSFYALKHLRQNRDVLAQHGVTVDINPIFLGGINVGSGNKPPWTLPAKARYGTFDGRRAARYFGVEPFTPPSFFPILSLLPMRSMLYVKRAYPEAVYLDIFAGLWQSLWREHVDISKPEDFGASLRRHFPGPGAREEIEAIVRAGQSPEYKKLLTDETARVVGTGAFGAPWFLVTNAEGVTEPFFGSDRGGEAQTRTGRPRDLPGDDVADTSGSFHYMWQYLGLPFTDLEILPPAKARI